MNVFYDKQPQKFLKKCHPELARRILDKLDGLSKGPVPSDAKRIVGETNVFRIRIGDYRALYRIAEEKIVIFSIDKRSRVY
jgi:mRNA interferase RelE/StbE